MQQPKLRMPKFYKMKRSNFFPYFSFLGPERGRPEVACQSDSGAAFTTGGGFSNLYEKPIWQESSHAAYFSAIAMMPPYVNNSKEYPSGHNKNNQFPFPRYNSKGRGYPDVSMLGKNRHLILLLIPDVSLFYLCFVTVLSLFYPCFPTFPPLLSLFYPSFLRLLPSFNPPLSLFSIPVSRLFPVFFTSFSRFPPVFFPFFRRVIFALRFAPFFIIS